MKLEEFKNTFKEEKPHSNWHPMLCALWYDGKGDWHQAHEIADGNPIEGANWVHAYLHRKEGDDWNARYWYRIAGKPLPKISLEEEWRELVKVYL